MSMNIEFMQAPLPKRRAAIAQRRASPDRITTPDSRREPFDTLTLRRAGA
ncbi:hypothetical protein [Methylobacterium planeticum]|nr:hypothetical protein [Methylobacterium planeticum]